MLVRVSKYGQAGHYRTFGETNGKKKCIDSRDKCIVQMTAIYKRQTELNFEKAMNRRSNVMGAVAASAAMNVTTMVRHCATKGHRSQNWKIWKASGGLHIVAYSLKARLWIHPMTSLSKQPLLCSSQQTAIVARQRPVNGNRGEASIAPTGSSVWSQVPQGYSIPRHTGWPAVSRKVASNFELVI
jgi:hypothetical protein